MEVFVDFGLFELFALSGLAALGRIVFRRPATRFAWLAVSVAAPLGLIVWSPTETLRWMATVAVATTVVNVAVLLRVRPDDISLNAPIMGDPLSRKGTDKKVA